MKTCFLGLCMGYTETLQHNVLFIEQTEICIMGALSTFLHYEVCHSKQEHLLEILVLTLLW